MCLFLCRCVCKHMIAMDVEAREIHGNEMKGTGKEVVWVFLQYYLRHFYKFHLFLPEILFLFLSVDLDPGKVGMGGDQRALCKQVIHSLNPLTPQIISSLSPLTFLILHIHSSL